MGLGVCRCLGLAASGQSLTPQVPARLRGVSRRGQGAEGDLGPLALGPHLHSLSVELDAEQQRDHPCTIVT